MAHARSIDLHCERGHRRVVALGDAGWLERLLLNLLDNAMKFTPEGGRVVVRVSPEVSAPGWKSPTPESAWRPTSSPHVFERFYQADPSRSSGSDGAGLGLSLVKWIVDRHHGTITVDSRPGQGSTFTVTLPGFHEP